MFSIRSTIWSGCLWSVCSPTSVWWCCCASPASGTLAEMNAFDLVVTVALGSTLATILLSADVSYLKGMLAQCALVGLQFVAAWVSTRWVAARRLLKSEPVLLLRQGRLLDEVLLRQRVTAGRCGSFSVVPRSKTGDGSALRDVAGLAE